MDFIGDNAWPAPRLKDATLSESRLRDVYVQCVKLYRTLVQKCRLVHADFSEYNLLYYHGKLYCIDVSQAVETDSPSAAEFMRHDCRNVTDFFSKGAKGGKGGGNSRGKTSSMTPMSTQELFNFVTDASIGDSEEEVDAALMCAQERVEAREARQRELQDIIATGAMPSPKRRDLSARGAGKPPARDDSDEISDEAREQIVAAAQDELNAMTSAQQVDEEVFMRTSVPQSLYEVDHEAEAQRAERGDQEEAFAQAIAGLTGASRGAAEEGSEGESSEEEEDEDGEERATFKKVTLTEEERAQ